MAREYCKKYNSICVLKANSFKKEDLEAVFSNIYQLFFMLDSTFQKVSSLKKFFDDADKLLERMQKIESSAQISPKSDFKNEHFTVNRKTISCLMLDILHGLNGLNFFCDENLTFLQSEFLRLMTDFYAIM
jgi:hypothetical protein